MNPTEPSPTLAQAKAYIQQIDFSQIINKMVKRDGWLRRDARRVCGLYKNYLFLRKKYHKQYKLPPSIEIDEFWHYHILDTRKYQQDCEKIFGKYHHHYPYFGFDDHSNLEDLAKAFSETRRLHQLEFGQPIYQVRNVYSKWIRWLKGLYSHH